MRAIGVSLTALVCLVAGASPAAAAGVAAGPDTAGQLGIHSMVYLDAPYSFKEAMFREAAAAHASEIRVDVPPALIFQDPSKAPDFSGLDEVMALSQQYKLPVLADLVTIPWWISDCRQSTAFFDLGKCGTGDLSAYAGFISQIVKHADGVIGDWEVWNEPDNPASFTGTPQQYAGMLDAADSAIKSVDPEDRVLLGGISGPGSESWLSQVFSASGADAAHHFDIANVHVRDGLDSLVGDLAGWRDYFTSNGFTGPIWVTEHGYPSDPAFQSDPGFQVGAPSQADYLSASVPTLLWAGAAKVFVTERDNLSGWFASEGLLGGDVSDPPSADAQPVEKPAFAAVATWAVCHATSPAPACPPDSPQATPATVTLPAAALGTATSASVAIDNPGPWPVALQGADLASQQPGLSLPDATCVHALLEPGRICELSVLFTPQLPGPDPAVVRVAYQGGVLSIPVTATALSSLFTAPRAQTAVVSQVAAVPPLAKPTTRVLHLLARTGCRSRSGPRVDVVTDGPGVVGWSLRRLSAALPARCRAHLNGRRRGPTALSGTARPARGRDGRWTVRLTLGTSRVAGRVRPGVYLLRAAAGPGPAASLRVALAGSR